MSSRTGPDDTRKPFVDKYFECAEKGDKEELSFLLRCKKFSTFMIVNSGGSKNLRTGGGLSWRGIVFYV